MGKVVRIPAGNTTNVHYNFVVAKPLVFIIESKQNTKELPVSTREASECWGRNAEDEVRFRLDVDCLGLYWVALVAILLHRFVLIVFIL